MAQLLPSLSLSAVERKDLERILKAYLSDKSKIVQASSLQALADTATIDEILLAEVRQIIEEK